MVAAVSLKTVTPQELFLDRLPLATQKAFLSCITLPLFRRTDWYLAGGTALAIQVGHRQSVDLDFFTPQATIREIAIERSFLAIGDWQTTYREAGTIYGAFHNAKMSLIAYPFFLPSADRIQCGTVRILAPHDVAAMKIIAISQRGRKRDFLDLYWYCTNRETLAEVVRRSMRQYPGQEKNIVHIIKSLTYFADAEADPMPTLFFSADWLKIKQFFRREAKKLAHEVLLVP